MIQAFKLKLKDKVVECLKQNPEQKFTVREIADWIFKTYPDDCQQKKNRSEKLRDRDNDALVGQIAGEITSLLIRERPPEIKTIECWPRKYYYTESSDSAEIDFAESTASTSAAVTNGVVITEHNLYPILRKFLREKLKIDSMRINEKHSSNSHGAGGNEWLYPDVVGMENLSQDWHREIKDCVKQYADKKTKLWSFEVKKWIDRSNVRKVFFQAVSNSSWANFGYLVAIGIREAALKELRILVSLHGIGVIKLNADNPSESQIMIPAKERNDIDWNIANRLANENRDFLNYIKSVREFYQTGKVHRENWDQ